MRALLIPLISGLGVFSLSAVDPTHAFYEGMARVRAEYRKAFSASLVEADKVTVYIVSFDGFLEGLGDSDPFGDDSDGVRVAPYGKRAEILKSKDLNKSDRTEILAHLAAIIAKPEHGGGAFCHYPIHGIRVYKDDQVLHDGTFCWGCSNFSFDYPEGSGWLDTDPKLESLFKRLLPIPKTEADRFYEKFPALKPKGEQDSGGDP